MTLATAPTPPVRVLKHSRATGPQREFWASPHRFRGMAGGVGSGKSRAGCVEVLRQPPGSIGMVVAPTYRMLSDSTLITFLDLVERGGILESFHRGEMRAQLAGGRTVLFRTSEHPDRLRGPNLGWFYIDEAAMTSHSTWKILLGRLRLAPGRGWATFTPRGRNWIHQTFTEGGGNYHLVSAPTWTNPFLPADFIPTLQQEYDEAFARQEIGGEFLDDATGQLLPESWVARMVSCPRDKGKSGPKFIAVDLAKGAGGDKTVLMVLDYLGIHEVLQSNLVGPADAALETQRLQRLHGIESAHLSYDAGGNTWSEEYQRHLLALGIIGAVPYNGSGGGGDKYSNRRTRAAFRLRSRLTPEMPLEQLVVDKATSPWVRDRPRPVRLQPAFTIPQDPVPTWWPALREELLALRYEKDLKRTKLVNKDVLAATLRRSPDVSDALLIGLQAISNAMGR